MTKEATHIQEEVENGPALCLGTFLNGMFIKKKENSRMTATQTWKDL
jgi:hypothetical protein